MKYAVVISPAFPASRLVIDAINRIPMTDHAGIVTTVMIADAGKAGALAVKRARQRALCTSAHSPSWSTLKAATAYNRYIANVADAIVVLWDGKDPATEQCIRMAYAAECLVGVRYANGRQTDGREVVEKPAIEPARG